MTDRLDTLLREVIHDLAAEGDRVRSEDRDRRQFALDATDRGYQHRNRRHASLVGAVALVLALALGIPYGLSLTRADGVRGIEPGAGPSDNVTIGPDGVPTHVITDLTRPIELVDGWYVLGNELVLDWPNKAYARIGGQIVQASPNGQWVGAWSRSFNECGRYRVTNVSTRETHTYGSENDCWDPTHGPQWSPDGDQLLFSRPPLGEPPTRTLIAAVVDVKAETTTSTPLDVTGFGCTTTCRLSWLPSGQEIALTISHPVEEHDVGGVATAIQTFTLDGRRARSLPIAGFPMGTDAWSPDGQLVAIRGMSEDGQWGQGQIVEVATGAVVHRMDEFTLQASWVDNDRILIWSGDYVADPPVASVTLTTRDGTPVHRWTVPPEIVSLEASPGMGTLAAHRSR